LVSLYVDARLHCAILHLHWLFSA